MIGNRSYVNEIAEILEFQSKVNPVYVCKDGVDYAECVHGCLIGMERNSPSSPEYFAMVHQAFLIYDLGWGISTVPRDKQLTAICILLENDSAKTLSPLAKANYIIQHGLSRRYI